MNTFDYNGKQYYLRNPVFKDQNGESVMPMDDEKLEQFKIQSLIDEVREADFEKAFFDLLKTYKKISEDNLKSFEVRVSTKNGGGFTWKKGGGLW